MPPWKAIPGETPIDDLSGLKVRGISLRSELDKHEAENVRKAMTKYFVGRLTRKKAPFDFSWSLRLHGEMFGDVWTWAGTLRRHDTNIGVPAIHVESQLYEFFKCLPYWQSEPWHMQAAMIHHRAVHIHPFTNGNGRWSRMLANIWLRLNGQPYTNWPEAMVSKGESVVRSEYLVAIREADGGDYAPLVELHRRFTPSER
jgi:Fic-DOC domain mobile mystery protein B